MSDSGSEPGLGSRAVTDPRQRGSLGGSEPLSLMLPSQLPGLPPLPSRNHSIMKHRRWPPLPVRLVRSHLLRSVSPPVPCVPATATSRPREFPERKSGGDSGRRHPRDPRAATYARRQGTGPHTPRALARAPPGHRSARLPPARPPLNPQRLPRQPVAASRTRKPRAKPPSRPLDVPDPTPSMSVSCRRYTI